MDTTQTYPHQISNTQRTENKTTDAVIQQHSRKLLMMDVLMSKTCWVHKKWNKTASNINLVFYSSSQLVLEMWGCNASVLLQHVSAMIRVQSATQILGSVTALQRVSRVTTVNAVTPTTTTMVTQQIRARVSVSMTVCFCGVWFCKLYWPWISLKSVWRLQKCM